jgi:hypothetical protein
VRLHGRYEVVQHHEATTGLRKRALQMVSLRSVYCPTVGKSISLGPRDTRVQAALGDVLSAVADRSEWKAITERDVFIQRHESRPVEFFFFF